MKKMGLLGLAAVVALALAMIATPQGGVALSLGISLCACGAAISRIGMDGRYSPTTVSESSQTTGTTAVQRNKLMTGQFSNPRNGRNALLAHSSTA
jgi:hypothetical protein